MIGELFASVPGQRPVKFTGQSLRLFDQRRDDAFSILVRDLMDTAFLICPSPFRFRLACLERRIVRFALRCSSSCFFSTPRA
jgi:hypothetical protein